MIVLLFFSNINNACTDLNLTFLTLSHGIHIRWQNHTIFTNSVCTTQTHFGMYFGIDSDCTKSNSFVVLFKLSQVPMKVCHACQIILKMFLTVSDLNL